MEKRRTRKEQLLEKINNATKNNADLNQSDSRGLDFIHYAVVIDCIVMLICL